MSIQVRCLKCKKEFALKHRKCPGCNASLRNNKRYRVKVKLPTGKWFSQMTETLEQARNVEAQVNADVLSGVYYRHQRALKMDALWPQYLEWAKVNKRSWKTDYERYTAHLAPVLESHPLNKITPVDVERVLDRMRASVNRLGKPYSPQTIKHVYNLLRRIINFAKERDLYGGENPCDRIKLPSFDNSVTNPMSETDQQNLIRVLDEWKNPWAVRAIKFLLFTGRRRGEVKHLKWQDVNIWENRVTFQGMTTKNRKTQQMPVSDFALDVLQEAYRVRISEYVFPCSTGKVYESLDNTWKRIRKKAGLEHIRMHDIRHTFATNIIGNGQSMYHLQNLLGHKTGQMTQRYAHLRDQELQNAANASNAMFVRMQKMIPLGMLHCLTEEEQERIYEQMRQEAASEPGYGEHPDVTLYEELGDPPMGGSWDSHGVKTLEEAQALLEDWKRREVVGE